MCIYLYKKTHNKTGLQYLGKTEKDPFKYLGSGIDWKQHLKEHGTDITTEILKECQTKEELTVWGRYYSELWNVAESSTWANRIPETGGVDSVTASINNNKRVKNKTHHLQGGTIQRKLVEEGTHPFLGDKNPSRQRMKAGTHHFLNPDWHRKRVKEQLKNGTHTSQTKKTCENCGKTVDVANYSRWHGNKCRTGK